MKRILLTLAVALMACSLSWGEELKWYSWNEGYALAKKENKPMLVFVQADWCNTCKRLEEKTFNDPSVIPVINDKFIPVKLNVEKKEEYDLGDSKVSGGKILLSMSVDIAKGLSIPTTVLWHADSKKSKTVAGLLDPGEMKDLLNEKVKR